MGRRGGRSALTDLLPSTLEVHAEVHRCGAAHLAGDLEDQQQQAQFPDRALELVAYRRSVSLRYAVWRSG
jgi:hypothetical protein